MKNFKRLFTFLLILVMAVAIFAGCEPKEPAYREGKVTIGIPGNALIPDLDTNGYTIWLKRTTGLDIEWVEFAAGGYNRNLQLKWLKRSDGTFPDILVGFGESGNYNINQSGEYEFVQDLKPLIDAGKLPTFKAQLDALSQETRDYVLAKGTNTSEDAAGAFFALPTVSFETFDDQQSMIYINKTWLERVGMDAPTNIEELAAVCKAFLEKDANGDGDATNEIPMLELGDNPEIRNWIINAFIEYNEGCFSVDANGTVWDPYVTDEFRQALKCISEFTKHGYYKEIEIADIHNTVESKREFNNLINPADGSACKVGIFGGHMESNTSGSKNVLEEFICLTPLADETGKGGYNIVNDVYISWDAYITKDCRNLDRACRVLDAFYLDESVTIQRWGTEGEYWVREEVENWFGSKSYFKVLDFNAFFDMSRNATMGNLLGIRTPENYLGQARTAANTADKRQIEVTRLIQEQWKIMQTWPKKQVDTLEHLVYTRQEDDYREAKLGAFDSYRSEQIVLFMKGQKNINSDQEWNAYVDQIKQLDQAGIMKTQQDAYNRKVGK